MSVIGKILLIATIFVVVTAVAYVAGEIVGPPHLPVDRQQVATVRETPSSSPSPSSRTARSRVLPAGTSQVPVETSDVHDQPSPAQHTSSPRRTPSPTAPTSSAAPTPTPVAVVTPTPTPTPTSSPTATESPTPTETPTPTDSPTPTPTSSDTPSALQTNASAPSG